MARIRGRDTGPEKLIRRLLRSLGYRFGLHARRLPGRPDVVLSKQRKAVFVHGCFWHGHAGCVRASRPATNVGFWTRKITGNMARDVRVTRELKKLGWKSLVVWQCQTKHREVLERRLKRFLNDDTNATKRTRQPIRHAVSTRARQS